eukprot:g1430.t1
MLATGLGPYQIGNGRNGCPVVVPPTTIAYWKSKYDENGEVPAITRMYVKRRGRRKTIISEHKAAIKSIVDRQPYLFTDEIADMIYDLYGVAYSKQAVSRALLNMGYTHKLLEERAAQACEMEQLVYRQAIASVPDPRQLIFLDETHKSRKDNRRRRGRSPKGFNYVRYVLFDSSERLNYTMIGAVDYNGFIREACDCVFRKRGENDPDPSRGSVDSERFVQYIEEMIVPILGNFDNNEPRSVVVMDNASIHKDRRVVDLIEGAGARIIWTAAYSPWLNPIEHCFNQYKLRLLRLETIPNVLIRHHYALSCVTAEHMYNYFKNIECVSNLDIIHVREERDDVMEEIMEELMREFG